MTSPDISVHGSISNNASLNSTGPVRGICFHSQQPLFVSGGDDYKIKVSLVELVELVEWLIKKQSSVLFQLMITLST